MVTRKVKRIRNFYALLGVRQDAELSAIRRGYRAAALRVHPDKVGDCPISEQTMVELNRVHKILADPEKRRCYDLFLDWRVRTGTQLTPPIYWTKTYRASTDEEINKMGWTI